MSHLDGDVESGYASASSSQEDLQTVMFTPPHLRFLNKQLSALEPQGTIEKLRGVNPDC